MHGADLLELNGLCKGIVRDAKHFLRRKALPMRVPKLCKAWKWTQHPERSGMDCDGLLYQRTCGLPGKTTPSVIQKLNVSLGEIMKERQNIPGIYSISTGNIIECRTCCLLHHLLWNTTSSCKVLQTPSFCDKQYMYYFFHCFLYIHYVVTYDVVMTLKPPVDSPRFEKMAWKWKLLSQRPSHMGWLLGCLVITDYEGMSK